MKTKTIRIGYFEVNSDQLVVSDPCYDLGVVCAGIIKDPKKGRWLTNIVVVSDQSDWGGHVAELNSFHDDHYHNRNLIFWKNCNFKVGVDSGQAGMFDLPVFKNKELKEPYVQAGKKEYNDRNTLHLIDALHLIEVTRGTLFNKLAEILAQPPKTTNDWYEMCCDKTFSDQGAGTIPGGVVSSSGIGDGTYNAFYAKDETGLVVAVKIVFISENGTEEEGED